MVQPPGGIAVAMCGDMSTIQRLSTSPLPTRLGAAPAELAPPALSPIVEHAFTLAAATAALRRDSQPNALQHRGAIVLRAVPPKLDDVQRDTRILARAFGLGRLRSKSRITPDAPFVRGFEHGTLTRDASGYSITRDRHPNPQFTGMRDVQVPSAVCAELLARANNGERVGVWTDSRVAEVGYHAYVFSGPRGRNDLAFTYDHVIDRVLKEPYGGAEALAREHQLGEMRGLRIEGARSEASYRRVLEFERGRIIIDRDTPDRLEVDQYR